MPRCLGTLGHGCSGWVHGPNAGGKSGRQYMRNVFAASLARRRPPVLTSAGYAQSHRSQTPVDSQNENDRVNNRSWCQRSKWTYFDLRNRRHCGVAGEGRQQGTCKMPTQERADASRANPTGWNDPRTVRPAQVEALLSRPPREQTVEKSWENTEQ